MTYREAKKEYIYIWFMWQVMRARYRLSYRCHMMLLSDSDLELNYYALMHLSDYINRFGLKRVIVVSTLDISDSYLDKLKKNNIRFEKVSPKQAELRKKISRMYGKFVRSAAADYPREKMGKHLSETHNFTKEEILCEAEYQLFEYERTIPYAGETR